jgi:hypothetical protein
VPTLTLGAFAHDVVGVILTQIFYYQNIAAENQDISTVAVVKIQISKLKM